MRLKHCNILLKVKNFTLKKGGLNFSIQIIYLAVLSLTETIKTIHDDKYETSTNCFFNSGSCIRHF